MKCPNCKKNFSCKTCKKCYDKDRNIKIKNGKWSWSAPLPNKLSVEQEQVLIGGLLGDFYLYPAGMAGNFGIEVRRALKDIEYINYQYNLYSDFCSTGIKDRNRLDKNTNKIYYSKFFRTRLAKIFTPFKNKWYPKGKKIIPKDLKLTPLTCAIWFCDDGSITKYGINKNRLEVRLATNGFKKKEVEFLIALLYKEIGCKFTMYQVPKKKQYFIWGSHDVSVMFINYIKAVFPKSMKRKSNVWKGLI